MRIKADEDVAMIIVGTDYKSSRKALDLANKYEKGLGKLIS